ncbi:MAG: hypothetical protein M3526_01585 [Actinomycetota bacterium]|nr:hypothetical protein [Actinomycetota bacterium]
MTSPILVPTWIAFFTLGMLTPTAAQTRDMSRQGKLSLGVSIGTSAFSGAARGTGDGGEQLLFIPYRPTMLGLSIGYGGDALRLEATAGVGEPGLAVRGAELPDVGDESLLLVFENAFRVRAMTGGASTRLWRLRGGPVLRASVAALVERWTSPDTPARTVVGGQAGLAMEVALTRSLVARAEGILGFTPASPFRAEDLPEGFQQRGTWRRSLGVAVSWRP